MEESESTSQKRKEIDESSNPPSKRARADDQSGSTSTAQPQPQSLSTWLKVPPPPPLSSSLTTSNPIFDKDSIFIAYVLPLTEKEANFKHIGGLIERLEHGHHKLPDVIAGRSKRGLEGNGSSSKKGIKPTHNMWAARHLALKKGSTGTRPDDYEPRELANDDGEKHGAEHLLKILREEGASDVLLICSRWYGGTLLGPVRFNHIETCAREAIVEYTKNEQVFALRHELEELDDLIDELRLDLAPPEKEKGKDNGKTENADVESSAGVKSGGNRMYRLMTDAVKLERLIKAKSMTIKVLVEKVAMKKIDVDQDGPRRIQRNNSFTTAI